MFFVQKNQKFQSASKLDNIRYPSFVTFRFLLILKNCTGFLQAIDSKGLKLKLKN